MSYHRLLNSAGIFLAIAWLWCLLIATSHCQAIQELPDNPTVQKEQLPHDPSKWRIVKPIVAPKGFWTVGRWDAAKPLRTNKEVLTSKSFILLELAMWGTTFASVQVNRNHRQDPPVPHHGELYIDAFVPAGVMSALHFVGDKYICRCVGVIAPAAYTARELYAADKGYYP